jgi:hypothetical protein
VTDVEALSRFVRVDASIRDHLIRRRKNMAVTALKKRLKTYHATMLVTRTEEWRVEAETPEEAKALLAAGQGHRCTSGECLHAELTGFFDDD